MSSTFIIYMSTRKGEKDPNLVRDIAIESSRNNHQKNITGVLMGIGDHFLQVLEGQEEILDELLEVIAKDDRHEALRILYKGTMRDRIFGRWSMGCVDLEHPGFCDNAQIERISKEIELACADETAENGEKLKQLMAEIPQLLVQDEDGS